MKEDMIPTEKAYRALINARKDARDFDGEKKQIVEDALARAFARGWLAGAEAQREAIATRLRKSSNWWGACVEECPLVTLPKGEG